MSMPQQPHWLAIESATTVTSVAVFAGPDLVGSMEYAGDNLHSKLLTSMIERLLADLELPRQQLAAVCVAQGPGSYTGLRVGVSAAKGLCLALDIPLLSVGSLDALAWQVQPIAQRLGAVILPMIDARRMEVYCQPFDADIRPLSHPEAKVLDEGSFADMLAQQPVLMIGSGAAKAQALFAAQPQAWVLPNVLSTARSLGAPGWAKLQDGQVEDLVTFEPFYLKDFVATISKRGWSLGS
jgi:tRNA threonylcarbamoyladenosine biosynthesis protein TsaB